MDEILGGQRKTSHAPIENYTDSWPLFVFNEDPKHMVGVVNCQQIMQEHSTLKFKYWHKGQEKAY